MTIEKRLKTSIIRPIKSHEYSGQYQVTKSNRKKNQILYYWLLQLLVRCQFVIYFFNLTNIFNFFWN